MNKKRARAVLVAVLMLPACDRRQTPAQGADPESEASTATETNGDSVAVAPPIANAPSITANGSDDGNPDLRPPELTPETERGVKGARNILLSFARAIELREYEQAWTLLSFADKQKWSKTEFAAMFADLGKTTVAMPTGTMEGAAGSSYYTAPITITGEDKDGRPLRIEGKAVLRRVNDVDGATQAQLRWHFTKLTLEWTH